jgi:threonine-phosphate decarboxylase
MNYQHGGDIKKFAKEIGCRVDEVIDLSSNINFVKPKIDIDFNKIDISAYPNYDKLKEMISELYRVKSSQIALFNGASTAIYSLFRELKLNHTTLYSPCYLEYKKSASIYNYQIELINRFKDINQEVEEGSLIIFVNPSTPDGRYYNIDKLMLMWMKRGCTILIDESFLDFTPFKSATKYIEEYNNLYIIKSMTKFYSSAGIRIGAVLSNSKNIQKLQAKEPLWKISEFDSQYLQSALRDRAFIQRSRELNSRYKKELILALKKHPNIEKIYSSSVNFLLIKLKNIDAKEFQKELTSHKIMVRNCFNFDFLDNSFVRIAVKEFTIIISKNSPTSLVT